MYVQITSCLKWRNWRRNGEIDGRMWKDTDKGVNIGTKEQPYGQFNKCMDEWAYVLTNEQKYGRTHVGKCEYTDNETIE